MVTTRWWVACIFALGATVLSFGSDQQKAEKQANRMTAMATDPTGRRVVNASMASVLDVKRPQLVRERRAMNLNYGSLFVAHMLTARGTSMAYIAQQMQQGKNIFQIGNELNADWKAVTREAKKLNRKIEENLYLHFLHVKNDTEQDIADGYELRFDGVRADSQVKDGEVMEAQYIYMFWHERAAQMAGTSRQLDTMEQQAARMDHTRLGGPQSGDGSLAPEAGGIPSK